MKVRTCTQTENFMAIQSSGNKDTDEKYRRFMNNGRLHGLRVFEHTLNDTLIRKYSMWINWYEVIPDLSVKYIQKINNDDISWIQEYKDENPDSKIENFKKFFKSNFNLQKSKPPPEYTIMMAELKTRIESIEKKGWDK